MRVIIVGAGIGGLAAALTLGRAGIDVQVFEQAPELREVGAGVQISPNATRILTRLGLGSSLARFGVRPAALAVYHWNDGQLIARHPLAGECEREFGAPYYHFYRPELLEILACPNCKTPVTLVKNGTALKCGTCRRVYPIKDDIPVMLVDEAKIEA